MKYIIKTYITVICIALAIKIFLDLFQSTYLIYFLQDNLISLLINLFAISCGIIGLVIPQLKQTEKAGIKLDYSILYKDLKYAIYEYLSLIFLSLIIISTKGNSADAIIDYPLQIILISVFLQSLNIIRDLSLGFIIIATSDHIAS